jgi:predicted DCC family thiol-disulfide oxidoreductase YuxK
VVKPESSIILFDGVCSLCEGVVRFVAPRDPAGRFHFAPLQSAAGRALLERHHLPPEALDTFVVIEGSRCLTRSDAAVAVAAGLVAPWSWLRWLRLVPVGLRDRVYGVVVRNRYRWFGRRESCMVPGPELRERFLDAPPEEAQAQPVPPGPVEAA